MTATLGAEALGRVYASASGDVHACADIDLRVEAGELVSLPAARPIRGH
jgi:putative ABC transport system ATP-binding protein